MRLRSLLILLCIAPASFGQVVSPLPPKNYQVQIRYRIETDRDSRVRTFRVMMAELAALKFQADDRNDPESDILDPSATRLSGTIASEDLEKLRKVIAVQAVLVMPDGMKLPTDVTSPVQVSLTLTSGLDEHSQRMLHEQAVEQLQRLGFLNGVGYDERGFTRVRGTVPAGQVENLLKDLRGLPAGWLLQGTPREKLPTPLRSVLPIRLIEVLPPMAPVPPMAVPRATSAKYSSDLRIALLNPAFTGQPMRVEAEFAEPITELAAYRIRLRSLYAGVSLEGIVGTLLTFRIDTVKELEMFAAEPVVRALRLPAKAGNTVKPAAPAGGDVLAATNIYELQSRGYRGQGRKILVLGGNFELSMLPANAVFFDLTPELSPAIQPAAFNAAYDATAAALAAHLAAPEATLVLVRVEPSAHHQLFTVAKAALGDFTLSQAQVARAEALLAEYDLLNNRRDVVYKEYQEAFGNLSDEDRYANRRKKAQDDVAEFKVEEAAFRAKYARMETLRKGIENLGAATAIVNTLVWDDGYPVDGLSEFAQFLNDKYTPVTKRNAPTASTPSWVQAASEATWSVWSGPALDADNDRVLDYAPANVEPPPGTWNRELNFLAMYKADGSVSAELPANTKVRIAIQWREAHDPNANVVAEPVMGFTLQLLRQLDATGKTVATDEFAEVGQSLGEPIRLMKTPSSGVYEQTLEVTLPAAGRYALRVLVVPNAANRFARQTPQTEIFPKIVVKQAGDSPDRIIFNTFVPAKPGVGVPADAAAAFTVGRCDALGRSLSLLGAGPGVQLRLKPDALVFGDSGSGAAAGTMAGLAACLAEVGVRPSQFAGTSAIQPNGTFALPLEWVQQLPPPRTHP